MGSKDRNFWLTDIGGRFRDLHILGCKAGTSGDAFMAMVKTRLVNEQGMNSTLELFLFNDEEGNACDKCESEEMFISFWNKGKVNKDNLPSEEENCSKRVEVRRSPRLNKTATVSGLKDMRPTRLDFEHEEQVELTQASVADNHVHESQSIPTQSSVAANHVQGYEDDQVNLPNVHQDECHPDDKPDFLFKDYDEEEDGEDESEDESGDDSEEETQEQMNYEDWVSMCARGIDVGNDPDDCNEDFNVGGFYEEQSAPVNASSDEDLPSQEVTQEEEAKWEEDFGQHLNEPQRLEMINEDTPEVTPGEISTGMAFGSMQAYKDHLREYAVLKHRDFKVKKGDKIRHYSYCAYRDAQKCAWMVNARKVPEKDDMTVTVRECNIEHTCKNPNEDYSRKCNAKFVAKYLLKTMDVASPVEKADDIAKKIIRPQLQTEIPKWVARHARRLVLAERDGTFETCYKKTPQLVIAATSLNPRSIGHFSWSRDDKDNRFESLILAYNAQIKGFMNGCRMVIGLDGAHLTGKFGGVMLSATGIDAQNGTGINILHPHRLRDKGRPCVKRKKSWYEKNKQPKRVTKCSVCKGLDHNILTCQGPPVGSNPKKKGVRMECSVNGDEFCITAAPTKKMRKALSAPTTATTSASKTATADVPPFSKGKEAATTPSSSTAGSQKKCKATAPSSSAAVDVGSKRKVPSTSSTPSSACFNQIFNGTVNISSQTINITEPSSKRVRKPNSKYQQ
ncbi:uncharacterized protein LOC113315858 [Papaver somniferum]|uniref:uncharacterized protein LOC113315858 n=1 Tax=Papaver somniferum TaxID=3469 RepID=UPI000E6F6774|nr:uncharacterized protein LOC113315858 [Papaver somniferum]